MELTSQVIINGARLDDDYTIEGRNVSPPLAWSDPPNGTQALALICDDPDAPSPKNPRPNPWVHWVLFNIPVTVNELPEGVERTLEVTELDAARQGISSWPDDNVGYRGPSPPPGSGQHRYFFKLYALDRKLELQAGATKAQLLDAMTGHILATSQLLAVYER